MSALFILGLVEVAINILGFNLLPLDLSLFLVSIHLLLFLLGSRLLRWSLGQRLLDSLFLGFLRLGLEHRFLFLGFVHDDLHQLDLVLEGRIVGLASVRHQSLRDLDAVLGANLWLVVVNPQLLQIGCPDIKDSLKNINS